MSELTDAAYEWRKRILEREQEAATEILQRYSSAYKRIEGAQRSLIEAIRQKQQAGENVSRAWLQRNERYQELLRQIRIEISTFAEFAESTTRRSVLDAVQAGEENARQLALAALDGETQGAEIVAQWNRLSAAQLQNLQGFLSPNSPVSKLLASLGDTTANAVKSSLFAGIAAGLNPRQIARELRRTAGYSAVRALTISRTETLRAFRSATLESYRANDDIVQGWMWLASLSVRTCPACLGLHLRRFELRVDFGSHPNCRCTLVPVTGTMPDMGRTGEEWFAAQNETTQRKILGKGKFEAYQRGEITLQDLIHEEDSRVWGVTRSEASLKEALENAKSGNR